MRETTRNPKRSPFRAFAENRVNLAHEAAAGVEDPVAYIRQRQAEAERAWFLSGSKRDLAVCEAFERSLDSVP